MLDFTPLEWIALVFAILTILKFLIFLEKPQKLKDIASKVWVENAYMKYLALLAFLGMAYLLLQELTIIQFFVAIVTGTFVISFMFLSYSKKEYLKLVNAVIKHRKDFWLAWIIYLGLSALVLKELFV